MSTQHIIRIQCTDATGLVYQTIKVISDYQLNIIENGEFVDELNKKFFLRCVVSGEIDTNELLKSLQNVLPDDANIEVFKQKEKRIVVMCTKEHHALGDLLLRHEYNRMNAKIVGVISNHAYLQDLVDKFDLPFRFISAKGIDRATHEKLILEQLESYRFDHIVLAKYMRILTPNFVAKFPNKIVNIHHSFLPAFIGANPYRQAFERGVKLIGATAHFVTNDLDEGPIIYQDVVRVNHTYSAGAMAKAGKNVETNVLSQALDLVFQDRVMICGNKTIVF